MMDKKKLMTLAVVISLAGTASLYLYTASKDTVRVNISEIDHRLVGAKLEIEGIISEFHRSSSAYLISLLEEGCEDSIGVFVEDRVIHSVDEQPTEIRAGATIRLIGILEDYEGELSLRVSVPGELIIIEKAYTSFTDISNLLENPEWYSGMELKVRGSVVGIDPSSQRTYFEIEPLEGGYHRLGCEVEGHEEGLDIINGDPVVFKGTFLYDTGSGRWLVRGSEPPDVKTMHPDQ